MDQWLQGIILDSGAEERGAKRHSPRSATACSSDVCPRTVGTCNETQCVRRKKRRSFDVTPDGVCDGEAVAHRTFLLEFERVSIRRTLLSPRTCAREGH